jgi:hypothetical protein
MSGLRQGFAKVASGTAAFAGFFLVSSLFAEAESQRQPPTGYDNSWYVSNRWFGEYPNGFAVISRKVVVTGRAKLDKTAPKNVQCELPYLGVIHPWNQERWKKSKVDFWSATRIQRLRAREDFVFADASSPETQIDIKAGDVIEVIAGGAEGFFTVRIAGKLYRAYQDLNDHVEPIPGENLVQYEEWFALSCPQGRRAYFLYPDDLADSGNPGRFQRGLIEFDEPNGGSYGQSRDLTEAEAREARTRENLP